MDKDNKVGEVGLAGVDLGCLLSDGEWLQILLRMKSKFSIQLAMIGIIEKCEGLPYCIGNPIGSNNVVNSCVCTVRYLNLIGKHAMCNRLIHKGHWVTINPSVNRPEDEPVDYFIATYKTAVGNKIARFVSFQYSLEKTSDEIIEEFCQDLGIECVDVLGILTDNLYIDIFDGNLHIGVFLLLDMPHVQLGIL